MNKSIKKFAALIALSVAASSATSAGEIKTYGADKTGPAAFVQIDCISATRILESEGFTDLRKLDSAGIQYRFEGQNRDTAQVILFNSESGGWVAVPR